MMSIYNGAIAYGTVHNPLTDSPFMQQFDIGFPTPPPSGDFMITEDGQFMLTETGGNLMILE
jgi:hypothetical protein